METRAILHGSCVISDRPVFLCVSGGLSPTEGWDAVT